MRYSLQEIEGQIIPTLGADLGLSGVEIDTHAGEINLRTFTDSSMMEGLINRLPFVLVQYQGRTVQDARTDATKKTYILRLRWRVYVGAQSLRLKSEAQLSAYGMLGSVFDALHGKVPHSNALNLSGTAAVNGFLVGPLIATAEFNPQSPLMLAPGKNENLIVNMDRIVVYSTDFELDVMG